MSVICHPISWKSNYLLSIILSINLIFLGILGLDYLGFQVFIFRQLFGLVYLTFVPGILILKILKIDKLGTIDFILYSVGISLSFIMFVGMFINIAYPYIGILNPISIIPLLLTFNLITFLLHFLCFQERNNFSINTFNVPNYSFCNQVLFLFFILFLSIFGTYLFNYFQKNVLIIIMILLIALSVVWIGSSNVVSKKLYPIAIFIFSTSLLLHNSLISSHLLGWDIHTEYYFANHVIQESFWDFRIPSNANSMLSITMIAPIYSILLDMDLIWVFKLIYPLIFSLVPVGLYNIFKDQTDEKVAFLSVFFFISLVTFYTEMNSLSRQQIAELYLVLILLVILNKNVGNLGSSFLLVLFSISLSVSHYGISYLFISWIVIIYTYFLKNSKMSSHTTMISSNYTFLFIVFAIGWYLYTTDSSVFSAFTRNIAQIVYNLQDLLNPESSQALSLIIESRSSVLQYIYRYLHLVCQFFIAVGVLDLIWKFKDSKFNKDFALFSIVNFTILSLSIITPYLSSSLNTSRLYQISLIFLSPFFIIGSVIILTKLTQIISTIVPIFSKPTNFSIVSIFLAIFLIFNTGLIFEVADDNSSSISLNNTIDNPKFNSAEVLGAEWILKYGLDKPVYSDIYRYLLIRGYLYNLSLNIPEKYEKNLPDSYIYFGSYNIFNKEILVDHYTSGANHKYVYIESKNVINNKSLIYYNGNAQIFY